MPQAQTTHQPKSFKPITDRTRFTLTPEGMAALDAAELTDTLNLWPLIPANGSFLDIVPAEDVCAVCGGSGIVLRPDAICYADEQAAETPCPACFPIDY